MQMMNDDDDVRSGNFHPELREQFQNANSAEKIVVARRYTTHTPGKNKEPEVSKQEEYQRKYDDYYQGDANNMIFHTGTFNGEENPDEDI